MNSPLSHLGDMPIADFLNDYWHKRPLLIRQAFPAMEPLLAADELAGLACEELVESRYIGCNKSGDWTLQSGPFDDAFFAGLPDSPWTLLVQAVDHWVPEASDFLQYFRFIPNWRIDDLMMSYATQGGGVGPHYDNYDVFLLQVEGERRWEVGGCYGEHSEIEPGKPVRILAEWEPEEVWVLKPGDMLYIPPCVGHNGVAETDGCVTYSIGYRAPQTGDMLMAFAASVADSLNQEDRYADADLSLRRCSGEITQSDLVRVQSQFRRFVDDPETLADWFGRLMTEQKYPEQAMAADEQVELTELIANSADLRRNEGCRLAFWQAKEQVFLFVNGQTWQLPLSLLELVQLLTEENQFPSRQVQPFLTIPEATQLLQQLLDQEVIYPL